MNKHPNAPGKNTNKAILRKIHLYGFGYYKWLSVIVSITLVICAITGILYNHQHDFEFIEKGRISTSFLPDSYQERLDKIRKAQGLEDIFPEDADSVPVMWLIQDLHTGEFFGFWGRIFYDLIGIIIIVLAISGCYLYLVRKPRHNKKTKRELE